MSIFQTPFPAVNGQATELMQVQRTEDTNVKLTEEQQAVFDKLNNSSGNFFVRHYCYLLSVTLVSTSSR